MTVTRRRAREWAIQMLTAADLNPPEDVALFMSEFWAQLGTVDEDEGGAEKVPEKYKTFAEERVKGVLAALLELDGTLGPLLENWDLYRLGTVERAVLRMGIWEMQNTDVPKPVIINEAVDLANWFSSPKTRHLVNGILDRYAKSVSSKTLS